jgi:rhomboid family GlyGly-CTERM serine protease
MMSMVLWFLRLKKCVHNWVIYIFKAVNFYLKAGLRSPWILLCTIMGLAACWVHFSPADLSNLDWQPQQALAQPWRAFTAAWVHWSNRHLLANLVGAAMVAVLGVQLRASAGCVLAFLLAWPLTHIGLVLRPELLHYGGLSGVLHAALVIVALHGLTQSRAQHLLASILLLGITVKVLSESPWGPVLRHPAHWDIAIAPLSHATGALSGFIFGAVLIRLKKKIFVAE